MYNGGITNTQLGQAGMGMGAGGILASFFGQNPFNQYQNYMNQGQGAINQYLGQAENYLGPYRQAGQFGINGEEGLLGQMANGQQYYNNIMSGYQMSPGAQFRMNTGMDAVKNAMMSQGLGGSGAQAKALTGYTQGVINQDQQNYLNSILGINNEALQGYGSMANMGNWAAMNSGQYAMDAGQDIAGIDSAEAQAAANQANSNNNNLFGGIGQMAQGAALAGYL